MPTSHSDVKTFDDFTRYYKDRNVLGIVKAVQKMICIVNDNKLNIPDIESGLTQRYLFKYFGNDYFTGFGYEQKHL